MMKSVRRRQAFLLEITFMCGTWTCKCHRQNSGNTAGSYERRGLTWKGQEDWIRCPLRHQVTHWESDTPSIALVFRSTP
jgi:hypothetical protein